MATPAALEPPRVILAGMVADLSGHDDERAPLVLLHGLTYSRRTWRPVLDELSRLDPGRRVLVPDLPGQGESPAQLPHTFDHLLEVLNQAVEEAALPAPVVVGHSHGGGLAAMYAARYPCRGCVSVDSTAADVPAFARLVKQVEPVLRSADFARVWDQLEASMQLHYLPPDMRSLLEATCTPKQDLLLSYWDELLEWSEADLTAMLDKTWGVLAARQIPQVFVLGTAPSPALRDFLDDRSQPHVALTIEDWSPSSHFPHLAHVTRFAELLARTAAWTTPRFAEEADWKPQNTLDRR